MKGPILLLLAYLLLGLESPLLHQLNLSLYAPDLALVIVLYVALTMQGLTGATTAFLVGLLKDGFAMGSPVGMFTEISVLVYFTFRFMAHKVTLRGAGAQMIVTFLATLLGGGLFLLLTAVFDRAFDSYRSIVSMIVPQALITAPFAPVVFFLCSRVDGLFARRKRESVFFS